MRGLGKHILWLGLLFCSCSIRPEVVRVVEGERLVGRYVDERAYEAYLRGMIAEQMGHYGDAEQAYLQAHDADIDGVELIVRLGAVQCRQAGKETSARETFGKALEVDSSYGPLFVERARCLLRTRDFDGAMRDARRALVLQSKDEESSAVLAEALEGQGKKREARAVLEAFQIWSGTNSQKTNVQIGSQSEAGKHLGLIDDSLLGGRLEEARILGVRARIEPGQIALRAVALGKWEEAREQARFVLSAEPGNGDARVALIAVGEWQEGERLEGVSRFGKWVLLDVLLRRGIEIGVRELMGGMGLMEGDAEGDWLLQSLISRRLR